MKDLAAPDTRGSPPRLGPVVVLDTSVWIREQLLLSSKARVLTDIIVRLGGVIGLPTVVRQEVLAVVPRNVQTDIEKANERLGFAGALLRRDFAVGMPESDRIGSAVLRRIQDELGDLIEDMPHTPELVDAALARVVQRRPPNSESSEQFRDSLILETALAAGAHRDIHLVTGDKAFFSERDPAKGPADEIVREIKTTQSSLRLYGDVVACAKELGPLAPEIGQERAAARIAEAIQGEVDSAAHRKLFAATERNTVGLDVIPTAQPGYVFIAFALAYDLESLPEADELERSDARLVAEGSCDYEYRSARVAAWNIDEIRLTWREADGSSGHATLKYMSASIRASTAVFKEG